MFIREGDRVKVLFEKPQDMKPQWINKKGTVKWMDIYSILY